MSEALPVILASASKARHQILVNAGITHAREAADVDEKAIRDELQKSGTDVAAAATALARAKATAVAKSGSERSHPAGRSRASRTSSRRARPCRCR